MRSINGIKIDGMACNIKQPFKKKSHFPFKKKGRFSFNGQRRDYPPKNTYAFYDYSNCLSKTLPI